MRDEQVGALIRAVRQRADLRQSDVVVRTGVSQTTISRVERGRIESMTLGSLRRLCRELEIEVILTARWRGADGVRLLDAAHAALVAVVVDELRGSGWTTLVEYTFSEWGERGSVDVVGWHSRTRTTVVVEVKSVLVDSQDLLAGLDRKCRLVPLLLARKQRWRSAAVGRVVVLADTSGNRRTLERFRPTFASALPAGTRDVRRWIAAPSGKHCRNVVRGQQSPRVCWHAPTWTSASAAAKDAAIGRDGKRDPGRAKASDRLSQARHAMQRT